MTIQVGTDKTCKTVKQALELADKKDKSQNVVIELDEGIYKEKLDIARPNLTIRKNPNHIGEAKITFDYGATMIVDGTAVGTANSCSVAILDTAENFTAENITIENSYNIDTIRVQTQGVALRVSGDRSRFFNCRINGRQDTLYIKDWARCYFENCYIEGTVDFIFGDSPAVFNNCEICTAFRNGQDEEGHTLKQRGFVAAPSHSKWQPFGYLFWKCKFTCYENIDITQEQNLSYIGRNWSSNYANITLIDCKVGKHIAPQIWIEWDKDTDVNTLRYFEYNTMDLDGKPQNTDFRPAWSNQLNDENAKFYNLFDYLKGDDNWDPANMAKEYSSFEFLNTNIEISEELKASNLKPVYTNKDLKTELYEIADPKECVYFRCFRNDIAGEKPKDVIETNYHPNLKALVQTDENGKNGKLLIYQQMGMGGKIEHDYTLDFPVQKNRDVEVGFWIYAESLERLEIFTCKKGGSAIGMILIDNNINITAYGRKGKQKKNLMPRTQSLGNWYYIQIMHRFKTTPDDEVRLDFKCYDIHKNLVGHYEDFLYYEGSENYIEQFCIRSGRGASQPIKIYIDTLYVK